MPYTHGKSIIKIAIAEDDELLQDALHSFIDSTENCKVVLQAYNGKELIEKLAYKTNVNLVLMDSRMPEFDGIEAARIIKKDNQDIKILFYSIYGNELAICNIIGAGGDGFVKKGVSVADLKKAIFEIMKNGQYFPSFTGILNGKKANGNDTKQKPPFHFTGEEILFLKQVVTDLTYEAIASKLKCTNRHIDYMRQGLFERLDIHSRVELALFAFKGGITV